MDIQVGQRYCTNNGYIAEIIAVDHSLDKPVTALVYDESNRAGAQVAQFNADGSSCLDHPWAGMLTELHEEPRVIWVRDDSLEDHYGNILTTEPRCIADGTNQLRPAVQPRWRKYQEVK